MWIALTLLGVLAVVFSLVLALLAVPVDLAFSVTKEEWFESTARLGWLFGLIGTDLGGDKKKPKDDEGDEEVKEKEEKPKKKGKGRGAGALFAVLRSRGFIGNCVRLAERLLRTPRVRELKIVLRVGLGDPAETGMLLAMLNPPLAIVAANSSFDITVEPDFYEEVLEGCLRGSVRVVPIRLIPSLVAFGLSPTTIRGLWAMWRARRR